MPQKIIDTRKKKQWKGKNDMTTWYKVHDSRTERPPEVDATSSATTVYERRNIQQETTEDKMTGGSVTQWVYEQREYSREEWADMHSPAMQTIMQAISDVELSVALLSLGGGEAV